MAAPAAFHHTRTFTSRCSPSVKVRNKKKEKSEIGNNSKLLYELLSCIVRFMPKEKDNDESFPLIRDRERHKSERDQ